MKSPQSHFVSPRVIASIVLVILIASGSLFAQYAYRTFNQNDLALKKDTQTGKARESSACFHFVNTTGDTVTSLHLRVNASVVSLESNSFFQSVVMGRKNKDLDITFTGNLLDGDSVVLCGVFGKKDTALHVTSWYWDFNGEQASPKYGDMAAWSATRNYIQPNGGYVRDYIYKRVVKRPQGVVIGLPNPTSGGWMRYKTADRKYYPHTGNSRCFDYIMNGNGGMKAFVGELKNPHVKKHDNHLVGELHALKLAIMANDSGVTEPVETLATAFGDLLHNDTVNVGDPCNGLTIREIAFLADSALTYCGNFTTEFYAALNNSISRINSAFDGPYVAKSFTPLLLDGTHSLADAYFLHENPSITPSTRAMKRPLNSWQPEQFLVSQNYPNPFNPQTTIEFTLTKPSVVTLTVFNILGQEIAMLLNRENLDDGDQSVDFDASTLPSGVYIYRLTAQGTDDPNYFMQTTKRMVLLK